MSEKLILQKLKFYYDYLKLRHMFPKEFEEKFGGKKGATEEVNRILDQIIFLNRKLEKIRKEKKMNNLPENMLEKINQDFAEIHKAIESGDLSDDALERVFDFSKKVELEAYKAKFAIELEGLFDTSPLLTSKTVLEKILMLLPADITPSFLPILAAFVVEKWEVLTYRKSAA